MCCMCIKVHTVHIYTCKCKCTHVIIILCCMYTQVYAVNTYTCELICTYVHTYTFIPSHHKYGRDTSLVWMIVNKKIVAT